MKPDYYEDKLNYTFLTEFVQCELKTIRDLGPVLSNIRIRIYDTHKPTYYPIFMRFIGVGGAPYETYHSVHTYEDAVEWIHKYYPNAKNIFETP